MFSVVFPGQGSQKIGMIKDLYSKFDTIKQLFNDADDILEIPLKNIIFDGPDTKLNSTENTQPAIFLVSYCIFQIAKKEFNINFSKAKFFAGHSLGEYSALACADSLSFEETLRILKKRGKFMQEAIPDNQGAMLAVLGTGASKVEEILYKKKNEYECFIANDNSTQQVVVSGLDKDIDLFSKDLSSKKIKNIKLNVSAPFHCKYMRNASDKMKNFIDELNMKSPNVPIVSNVTAKEVISPNEIKSLLISQIEEKVRWLESVNYMIKMGVKNFIEIGPGKVLSGLIKRINKDVKIISINCEEDIINLKND